VATQPRQTDLLWPDPKTGPWWIKVWWRVQHGVPTPVGLSITSWIEDEDYANPGQHNNLPLLGNEYSDEPAGAPPVELPRLDGQLIRSLPVGAILDALRAQMTWHLNEPLGRDQTRWPEEWRRDLEQWREETAAERAAFNSTRRGRDLGGDHYLEVAQVYAQAVQEGRSPTKAVADHFHVEKSSAAKKVARARERGFLPKTSRGRVGPLTKEL
jgi:hypothetical protein